MRHAIIVLWMLLGAATSALAQVSIGIGLPGVSIGINLPLFPELVPVPGYPVYYAPGVDSNFFFYDGMYWVYQSDNWYTSEWYNGPWQGVGPEYVPLFVLRVPVRYYRRPPVYFRGWQPDAPPRWGDHWGNDWQQRRSGWDRWNRASAPAIAPLPVYQRQYSGDRYPRAEQQQTLRNQNYRYQPREAIVRQHFQEHAAPAPARPGMNGAAPERNPRQPDAQRPSPPPAPQRQSAPAEPREHAPQRGGQDTPRPAPPQGRPQPSAPPAAQEPRRVPQQGAAEHEAPAPRSSPRAAPQGKEAPQEQDRGQGREKERGKGDEQGKGEGRGQGRN